MKKKISLFFIGLCLLATGCYYNKQDVLDGGVSCDTGNVTYNGTITSIIQRYACLTCHSGNSPLGGFNLETYNQVHAKVLDGRLFGAINHSPGYIPMPQALGKMDACDIRKVKVWIDAGAPNN